MIQALQNAWRSKFSDAQPIAHELRTRFEERWVRFHSLPLSKRHAESEFEYQTILALHNDLLDDLSVNDRVYLITTEFTGDKRPSCMPERERPELIALDPYAEFWRSLPMHEIEQEEDYPNYWNLYASRWTWSRGIFDGILRLVADDEISNVMITSDACSWLYHPYDGGADVILPSASERNRLRKGYRSWLPQETKQIRS